MRYNLPKSWGIKPLGQLIIQKKERHKNNDYVEVPSVSNERGFIRSEEYFKKQVFSKKTQGYKVVRKGDFAYNPSRINVGSIALLDDLEIAIVSPIYEVFKPKESLLGKYLLLFLKSPYGLSLIRHYSEGSVRDSLKYNGLSKIPVLLPSLPTQHKIVEILEEADNLRKLRQQADEKMKDFIPSLFVQMFGDPATNPKEWMTMHLEQVSELRRGPFGGSLKKEIFVKEGYKVYEQRNAIYNDFNIGEYFIDEKKYKEMSAFAVKPDDLIVSCSGTMGKVAIIDQGARKGIINQALLKITPNQEVIIPIYLKMIIESESVQGSYFRNTSGSAIQNVTSVGTLKRIKIPLPPLPLQQEFAKFVEEIENEKARQAESRKKLDELFNSLMHRAFTGELVA